MCSTAPSGRSSISRQGIAEHVALLADAGLVTSDAGAGDGCSAGTGRSRSTSCSPTWPTPYQDAVEGPRRPATDNNPYAGVCTGDCKLDMVVDVRRRVGPSSRAMRQSERGGSRRRGTNPPRLTHRDASRTAARVKPRKLVCGSFWLTRTLAIEVQDGIGGRVVVLPAANLTFLANSDLNAVRVGSRSTASSSYPMCRT
jgi:hypothetical protein